MKHFSRILFALLTVWTIIECKANDKDWMIGGWNTKHWGAIRLLDDGYVIDLDPEGKLQNWGIWQNFNGDENEVLIIWMDSSLIEIIQRDGDKFYRQSGYPFGINNEIIEVKKIFKEDK